MNPLLPFMEYHLPLGLDQNLSGAKVADALAEAFTLLCSSFGVTEESAAPVYFSVDSDETAQGVFQDDNFELQVTNMLGIPNAKICHMRLYANKEGFAHWHAIFGKMDANGDLVAIKVTDSRLKAGKGITAQQDIESNTFLKQHQDKIKFEKSEQQPFGESICWIYCLANLAALATTGEVYTSKTKDLGKELRERIEKTSPATVFSHQPLKSPEESSSRNYTALSFFLNPPDRKPQVLTKIGTSSLLSGAGVLTIGALSLTPLAPLSLPISLTLIIIGLLLALAGAAMLVGNSCSNNNDTNFETNIDTPSCLF